MYNAGISIYLMLRVCREKFAPLFIQITLQCSNKMRVFRDKLKSEIYYFLCICNVDLIALNPDRDIFAFE